MNSNDAQLIMIIFLNNDKSKCFKKETKDLISLENIKREALKYFEIKEQNIDLFKLTDINNKDINKDEDLIIFSKSAKEGDNENLICEIKLLSEDINHNINEKLPQNQENINNINSNETIKITKEENKEIKSIQNKKEQLQNLHRGDDISVVSSMKNQNNNTNNKKENTETIPTQNFNNKINQSDNGDTLPESQNKENKGKNQILCEQSGESNVGETKDESTLTKTEILTGNINGSPSKLSNENQEKVQGGCTEESIKNNIDKKNHEEKGILNTNDYENIKEENEQLKKENEKLKKENDENKKIKEENEQLKKENEKLKKENEENKKIKEENKTIKEENEKLKKEKDENKKNKEENEQLKKENEKLKKENEENKKN